MALIKNGYWNGRYWPSRYWQEDYWPEYGAPAVTPKPSGIHRRRQKEEEDPAIILMEAYLTVTRSFERT